MNWLWENYTKVCFGKESVTKHLADFVLAGSRILCTYGSGSIEKNGVKKDVETVLKNLNCSVVWEGGIQPNPNVVRCSEIASVVRSFNPDLVLAVGGGSVIDATKLICLGAKFPETKDLWDVFSKNEYPGSAFKFGVVLTMSATGSEWNSTFVISNYATDEKLGASTSYTYPVFSLIDPSYQLSLPIRQLRNGVFDGMTHILDQFITPEPTPLLDDFLLAVLKELITIGPDVVQKPTYENLARMAMADSFALNKIFQLGKRGCWAIHGIASSLTVLYGIDHGTSLAIISIPFYEFQFENRKILLAKSGEGIWGATGTDDQKARTFVNELKNFIVKIGLPLKCSEVEGVQVKNGDVDKLVQILTRRTKGGNLGFNQTITLEDARRLYTKVVL